jgi:hypothetical protein
MQQEGKSSVSPEELGPLSCPYPACPYPPKESTIIYSPKPELLPPEGHPMIEEQLPAFQKNLQEFGEEPSPKGETGKKTSAPTTQKGN